MLNPALKAIRHPFILPVLLVVVIVTIFYGGLLFTAQTTQDFSQYDKSLLFTPFAHEHFDYLQHHGRLPLWNDRVGLGIPDHAYGRQALLYPPKYLAYRFAPDYQTAADILVWGHILLAALGMMALMYFYFRNLWVGAFTGLIYALGCATTFQAYYCPHASIFFAAAPLTLLGTELVWKKHHLTGIALLSLGVAIQILGAKLQMPHFFLHLVAIVVLFRLFTSNEPWRARLPCMGSSAVGVILGLLMGLPTLFYFFTVEGTSIRRAVPFESIASIDWSMMTSFLSLSPWVGKSLYMGPLVPILLVFGLCACIRRPWFAVFPLLFIVIALICFKTFLFKLLYTFICGWKQEAMLWQSFMFLGTFPLAILAGIGLNWLISRPVKQRSLLLGVTLILLLVSLGVQAIGAVSLQQTVPNFGFLVPLLLIAGGVLLLGMGLLLVFVWRKTSPFARTVERVIIGLLLVVNLGFLFGINGLMKAMLTSHPLPYVQKVLLGLVDRNDDPAGRWMTCNYEPDPQQELFPDMMLMAPGRWFELYHSFLNRDYFYYHRRMISPDMYVLSNLFNANRQTFQPSAFNTLNANLINYAGISRVLAHTGSTWVDFQHYGWIPGEQLSTDNHKTQHLVLTNPNAFPMAYLSGNWVATHSYPEEIIRRIAQDANGAFESHVDYVHPDGSQPMAGGTQKRYVPLHPMRESAEEVVIPVPQQPNRPQLLVFLDQFYPGWRAYEARPVNGRYRTGRELPVFQTNVLFRGVLIYPDTEAVIFKYQPPYFTLLISLAVLTFLFVCGLLLKGIRRIPLTAGEIQEKPVVIAD